MAWNSSRSSRATLALRPGGFTTRPSDSSTRRASRTGMKLTSSCSASLRSDRLCPGGRAPARIERRISLVTCSDSDRLSMGRTDPELADVTVMSAPAYVGAALGDDIKNISPLTVITYQAYG